MCPRIYSNNGNERQQRSLVMKITSYYIFILCMFFLASCGRKSDHYRVLLKNDGKIKQKSETRSKHLRLHLSFSPRGWEFSGTEAITTFESINQKSLPIEKNDDYYGVVIRDSKNLSLYEGLFKRSYHYERSKEMPDYRISNYYGNIFYEKTKERPDYLIAYYRGGIFFDIPIKTDIDKARSLDIIDLRNDKVMATVDIKDVKKTFKEKKTANGWDGEKAIFKIYGNKPAEQAFDLVVLAEGFSKEEISLSSKDALMKSKFGKYTKKYILPLLDTEPFSSLKESINIWVVATTSLDSGVSNLTRNINKKTVYDAAFGIGCLKRVLAVRNEALALTMASETPFDQIIVLVNSETYGGESNQIATFSVHKSAPYLIKHELAHSIVRFSDEYNSLNDDDVESRCEDHQQVSRAFYKPEISGGNDFFEQDEYLAPNLTLFDDPKKAKWAHLLTEDSPVVYFDYPKEKASYVPEIDGFSWSYVAQRSRDQFLLTVGPKYHDLINAITNVMINDSVYKFSIKKVGETHFVKITDFSVKQNDEINVVLKFTDKLTKFLLDFPILLSNSHLITLPSRTFTGAKDEIGLFQGSNVDLVKTFRASFDNIMISFNNHFNLVQIEAYKKKIEYYINIKNAD